MLGLRGRVLCQGKVSALHAGAEGESPGPASMDANMFFQNYANYIEKRLICSSISLLQALMHQLNEAEKNVSSTPPAAQQANVIEMQAK